MTYSAKPEALRAFGSLAPVAADALLGITALFRSDERDSKIDLGVGVYRDAIGATPVMRAVKKAETELLRLQASKSYLGAEGDIRFTGLLAIVALGEAIAGSPRLAGVQTPGGTGALRLGAELLKRARPEAVVWIGEPTWPNHGPIFMEAGIAVRSYRFYDVQTAEIDFDGMTTDLSGAKPGDVLLLHGCCHNPSGVTLADDEWLEIVDICERRGLIPFVDLAYQGLGDGLNHDAVATRNIFERLPAALLAYSCDKNFGLYRDRVGALWVQAPDEAATPNVRGNTLSMARSLWSMPPDHGAALVRIILDDPYLQAEWVEELTIMRERINALRSSIASAHPSLGFIGDQRGMFALMPIDCSAIAELRERHGIYMAASGRINLAGLTADNMSHFVEAITPHLL